MQNRSRIAIMVLAAVAALACIVPICVGTIRDARRPPVVITMPPGGNNPPLPYGSTSVSALNSAPSSAVSEDESGGSAPTQAATDPSSPSISSAPSTLYIHVAGAVRHPGVYQLADGARVFNAIRAAGGALAGGDTDAVNLAEKLEDGEKVTVPLKGQSDVDGSGGDGGDGSGITGGPALDLASAGPALKSGNGLSDAGAGKGKRGRRSKADRGGAAAGGRVSKITQGKININTATAEQMERLPGVGPALAARIIVGRKALGGFQKPSDLLYIRGLGQGKYALIAPFVTT